MGRRITDLSRFVCLIGFFAVIQNDLAFAQEPPLPAPAETSATPTASPSASPTSSRPQLNIPEIPLTVEPPTLVPELAGSTSAAQKALSHAKTAPLSELDAAFQQSPL